MALNLCGGTMGDCTISVLSSCLKRSAIADVASPIDFAWSCAAVVLQAVLTPVAHMEALLSFDVTSRPTFPSCLNRSPMAHVVAPTDLAWSS